MDLHEFCRNYLLNEREFGGIPEDTSDAVIEREAERMERSMRKMAQSFVTFDFDSTEGLADGRS